MMPLNRSSIAVIGDEDLVNGLRLAGVRTYYTLGNGEDSEDKVKSALTELINDPKVGIIVIQEDYAGYTADAAVRLRETKRLPPIIIEVPSKHGTKYGDVTEYYKAHIRGFIGFEVEI